MGSSSATAVFARGAVGRDAADRDAVDRDFEDEELFRLVDDFEEEDFEDVLRERPVLPAIEIKPPKGSV